MLIHIVKNNETINQIMDLYHVSLEEIVYNNSHITDFDNLMCGTKIKIPLINEEVDQILSYSEGFVYPYADKLKDVKVIEERTTETYKKEVLSTNREYHRAYPGILPPKSVYNGNKVPK